MTLLATDINKIKSLNAGLLIGAYTMIGSLAVIIMDLLGGYLF